MRDQALVGRALDRVARIEHDYRMIKIQRIEAWHTAHTLGATQQQIAQAAGIARTTVHDQLWIRA